LPLAAIGVLVDVPAPVKVSCGPVEAPPPPPVTMPVVYTVVVTQPLASVTSGTSPEPLMLSSLQEPEPRLLKANCSCTPWIGLCSASFTQAITLLLTCPGIGFGLTMIFAGATPG